MSIDPKQALVLVALDATPLDRIRLMKTLFLVWYRKDKPTDWPFRFEPYLYGPYAFDLYTTLEVMERERLIVQVPHPTYSRAPYYLTPKGKKAVFHVEVNVDEKEKIREIALWASQQSFQSLLTQVYKEAPQYAKRSVFQNQ